MRLLVDADSLLFQAACVAKKKNTTDTYRDKPKQVCERVDFALHQMVGNCFADEVFVAVKGTGNFRYKIFPEYKSHRPELGPNLKERLNAAHAFVLDQWNAVRADGMEADDLVSIWAAECRRDGVDYIVAHIDKDLNMIPGRHYNYNKEEVYDIDDCAAYLAFCIQLLIGDSSDGIPNLKRGLGVARAKDILEPLDPDDYMGTILDMYARHYGNGYQSRLNLIGNLLWMKQTFSEDLEFNYEDRLKNETDLSEQNVLEEGSTAADVRV